MPFMPKLTEVARPAPSVNGVAEACQGSQLRTATNSGSRLWHCQQISLPLCLLCAILRQGRRDGRHGCLFSRQQLPRSSQVGTGELIVQEQALSHITIL